MRVLIAMALSLVGGCGFFSATPGAAVLYCSTQEDCPTDRKCDVVQHLCRASSDIGNAPAINDARFDPPAARTGIARFVVVADRDLDETAKPQVTFADGAALVFLDEVEGEGAERALLVDVDAAEEGIYPITSVAVTGTDGAVGASVLSDIALTVDRTPPAIESVELVDPPPGEQYADEAPFNVVTALFVASEPVAAVDATITLGGDSGTCTGDGDDARSFTCSLTITAAAGVNGIAQAIVRVRDLVGNEAAASLPLDVDTTAPSIVPDTALLTIETLGVAVSIARAGSVLTLELVVDERLDADPVVVLDVFGSQTPFSVSQNTGNRWTLTLEAGDGVPAGTFPIRASFVDVFGHASGLVDVALLPPFEAGVPFSDDGGACARPSGLTCVDYDGDGHAANASCASGDDDDDLDPTKFPGAFEIPGDGVDNNGIGGDQLPNESFGAFVDSEAGSDAGAGTRAAPFRTLDAAIAQLGGDGQGRNFLFLADRATPYLAGGAIVGKSFVGGLDPATWTTTGGRSLVNVSLSFAALIANMETDANVSNTSVVVRSRLGSLGVSSTLVIDVVAGGVGQACCGPGSSRFIRSTLASISVEAGSSSTLERSRVFGGTSVRGGTLLATNSIFESIGGPALATVFVGTRVRAFHSTFRQTGATGPLFDIIANDPVFEFVASDFVSDGSGTLFSLGAGSVSLIDVSMEHPGGPLIDSCVDAACVNACAFPGCTRAIGVTTSGVTLDTDSRADLEAGAPPSLIGDFDGDCRYTDGSADRGADEAR